jgi:hypothetical protein
VEAKRRPQSSAAGFDTILGGLCLPIPHFNARATLHRRYIIRVGAYRHNQGRQATAIVRVGGYRSSVFDQRRTVELAIALRITRAGIFQLAVELIF